MLTKPLTIFGSPVDEGAVAQIERCLEDDRAVEGALMADHHLGYSMPIGGVIAYEDAVSPSGAGFDIACGNKAVLTDVRLSELNLTNDLELETIMREIQRRIAFGVGRKNPTPVDHALFDQPIWDALESHAPGLRVKAMEQLGTVGSGNHYIDVLADENDRIWVANHFGSRGLGHTIATGFMNLAKNDGFTDRLVESEEPTVLPIDTDLGAFYFEAMNLAGDYAYAGRDHVIDQVLEILGARALETVHNHHNFIWHEHGRYVVRKGATPLTAAWSFIGGSMGDYSLIVRGTGHDIGTIGSAPHGAGRLMSRTRAAGKFRKMWVCNNRDCDHSQLAGHGNPCPETCPSCQGTKFRKLRMRDPSTAEINWTKVRTELASRGIVVLGAGADEAPDAYKNLADVIAAHANVEVLQALRPIGVVMAGADTFDPYKD